MSFEFRGKSFRSVESCPRHAEQLAEVWSPVCTRVDPSRTPSQQAGTRDLSPFGLLPVDSYSLFSRRRAPACARYGLRVSCPAASTALKPDTSEASQAKVSGLRAHDLGARARVLVVRVVR